MNSSDQLHPDIRDGTPSSRQPSRLVLSRGGLTGKSWPSTRDWCLHGKNSIRKRLSLATCS